MRRVRSSLVLVAAGLLCACAGGDRPARAAAHAEASDWHIAANDADRDRLRRWRVTFLAALAKARPHHAAEIAAAGALLNPDAALDEPQPPAGDYRCRTIKLAGKTAAVPDFVADPPQPCQVDSAEGQVRVRVTQGPQRPHGRLLADDRTRMVFLGALQLGDESRAIRYGVDDERDMAGIFERIGPRRWRLVLPDPHWQSMLEVVEVVPAT